MILVAIKYFPEDLQADSTSLFSFARTAALGSFVKDYLSSVKVAFMFCLEVVFQTS
jgi:hypothetical protein